jgi:hypothetical protein
MMGRGGVTAPDTCFRLRGASPRSIRKRMTVNRRSFLKSGASVALAAAFGLVYAGPVQGQGKPKRKVEAPESTPGVPVPFGARQSPLFYFTRGTFQPYVGGVFIASAGSRSISMTLVEVSGFTPKAWGTFSSPGRVQPTNSFALKFSSTDRDVLTDLTTIYDIRHAALGEFPLFMTRREGPDGTSLYEAVFNHLL